MEQLEIACGNTGSAKHSPKITDLTHPKLKVPEQIARQKARHTETQAAADQGSDHLETQAQEEKQNEYVRQTTSLLTQTFGMENTFYCGIYRVINKSLRDFRPLRYSSRDGHAEGEHVNRGRDNPSYCPTLQVLDMSTSW